MGIILGGFRNFGKWDLARRLGPGERGPSSLGVYYLWPSYLTMCFIIHSRVHMLSFNFPAMSSWPEKLNPQAQITFFSCNLFLLGIWSQPMKSG